MKRFPHDLRFLALLILLVACSSKPEIPFVAKWEKTSVNVDEFIKSYVDYASSAPIRDSYETRKNYATYLLEQKIIADVAKKAGLDTLKEVQVEIKLRKENILRQQYMRSIMDSRVKQPEEMEVREMFRRKSTGILLEQIFAKSFHEIDSLNQLLKKGASFEKLAKASMRKYNPDEPDSTYKMGWITYGDMDLAPEEVAFNTAKNEISKPVQSLNGWHIFRVKQIKSTDYVNVKAYATERDQVAFNLYKRKYEEATQHFLDSTYNATSVKINTEALQKTWTKIKPWLNKDKSNHISIILTIETGKYADSDLPRSTTLAQVGDSLYTLGQFFDNLQVIPTFMLKENLTDALKFAIKDSIFAKRAQKNGFESDPLVKLEVQTATTNALYFAHLRTSVDTLSMPRIKNEYYEKWKSIYFIDSLITTYRAYVYPDSARAAKTIEIWSKDQDFPKALKATKDLYKEEIRTSRASIKEIAGIPEHNLPMDPSTINQVFAGPYIEKNGTSILIAPKSRDYVFFSRDKVDSQLEEIVQRNLAQITHEQILPKNYKKTDVKFDKEQIDKSLPYLKK